MADGADMLDDFARLDFERAQRCGFPEVVYGAGKTAEQTARIMEALLAEHGVALATRVNSETAAFVRGRVPQARYFDRSGMLFADVRDDRIDGATLEELLSCPCRATGRVLVACAGTSDLAVAEEAAVTARVMGSAVDFLPDIGVAGVHRALRHVETLRRARVIVCVAGMEGALASLVAGLVDVPVVAVPTSVGYGASFSGVAALLGMLSSCAGGVSVVNIDNGFGAGQVAHRINAVPARLCGSEAREAERPQG